MSRLLLVAALSALIVPASSYINSGPSLCALRGLYSKQHRSTCTTVRAQQQVDGKPEVWRGPGNPNKKVEVYTPNWSDDFVDDLTGKRFGNGWAFYGERETLKDKDYDALAAEAEEMAKQRTIRENPVLVIGGETPFGQWIALEAMKRDLNVRILASDFDNAEFVFGTDGANADIYFGDVSNLDQLDNALDGAQSIIYAAEGTLPFGPSSFQAKHEAGLNNVLEVAKRYPSIRRAILVTPQNGGPLASMAQPFKDHAEQALRTSGLPYVILRPAQLSEVVGGELEIEVMAATDGTSVTAADTSVTPMDFAQVAVTVLLMDDVSARAEQRAAESGQPVPNLPRAKPNLTLNVANRPSRVEGDQFSALVKAIATQPADS
eukprot:CAMPEP_0202854716 /NCGR_PEP_ID=MMETSP1389-20130828/91145_1 /ASSEMBLY_ACC=CAM_ASM_000865 /TAXON_ID=302021 /ORGANISM="Rhodomonas sp., Strain CCMP768" /LENGTH=376 /DNA_ID=CAMNT_0049533313 /DNA_START=9 /DNA_END=1139 /DNA_ORIENTATION=+